MTNNTPPFLAGQAARRAGEPITANPYPERHEYGENYPGRYWNWRAGWQDEDWLIKHGENQ